MGTGFADAQGVSREFALSSEDFRSIAVRIRRASGIVLGETKRDLVHGRLSKRLRVLGCSSFADYLKILQGPGGAGEEVFLVNAITTNLTAFFREQHHFELLSKEILPSIAEKTRNRRLRIWSAGCSSGEEPYTIAMTLQQSLRDLASWDALVLATDIDGNMIATAQAGRYDCDKAGSIPTTLARRFVHDAGADGVVMSDELKRLIRFRRLNLLQPWPMQGPFDVIFCRNVCIYFDKDTQRTLYNRYADILQPEGWLFLGHSESLFRTSDRFVHLGNTAYRKLR